MQLKVVSALAFVTLVAAVATPTIPPPFPGNPLPTIGASKCGTGKLQCCKLYFHQMIVIVLWWTMNYYRQECWVTYYGCCFQRPRSFGHPSEHYFWSCRSCLRPDRCRQPLVSFLRFMNLTGLNLNNCFASPNKPVCCTDNSHSKWSAWVCFLSSNYLSSFFPPTLRSCRPRLQPS